MTVSFKPGTNHKSTPVFNCLAFYFMLFRGSTKGFLILQADTIRHFFIDTNKQTNKKKSKTKQEKKTWTYYLREFVISGSLLLQFEFRVFSKVQLTPVLTKVLCNPNDSSFEIKIIEIIHVSPERRSGVVGIMDHPLCSLFFKLNRRWTRTHTKRAT